MSTSSTSCYNDQRYVFIYFDNEFFNWHLSYRFGEATNPGPTLSIVSVNVTSLLLHYQLFLSYDIVLVQESRLTEYGQTYLQHILNEQGWTGIWSMPRPPQRNNSDSTNLTGKCGGVAILFRQSLQFQTAPQSLLQNYPCLCSHRFLHGILSTETGPTLHFMTVYGYTGADVHGDAQTLNDSLMSSVFDYASGFGNTPIYIGMDANTDNLSSSSLSQVSLSQRWFDIGSHFAYLQNDIPSPTCFAKGNPAGRRIDYIFANSPAVTAIQEFSLETAIPIPTHKPLCITIQVHLFSSSVTRLALPPTTHTFPRPTTHFLNVFTKLFQWDIQAFGGDVEQAYSCWNEWAQQYLTLLTNTTFHSRGTTPCIRKGLLALPLARELPNSKRPFITLYNRTISAISELHINPDCLNTPRFRTFLSQIATEAVSLLHNFVLLDDPHQWLPQLREALLVHRLTEQATIRQQRKTAWQSWIKDTWALNSKKIYQLIKGKFVEPFTCLQTENGLITDRTQIDALLQTAWNPIFAKYPTPEDKASEYRNSFYPYESPFPTFSLPPLTLDDFHYVLSKKLKPSAATGLDGWRPLEIKQLPDCLLQALLDVFHLCETQKKFPSSFYYSYTTLIPKGPSRAPLSLRPITVLPVPYRIYASLRCQTLLNWQNSWIHPSQFAFCKGRSTTSLNSSLSFDLLQRYQNCQSFAGIQFDFAKCFDSIPFSVIWDILLYHGCDVNFVALLQNLYCNMSRCFRYAGCIGSFWQATNGLLQGDPLSVVILNCVLAPLLRHLSSIEDLSLYAFADDLTVVSSSWEMLHQAYQCLQHFSQCTDLVLNTSKCQLWNKGTPSGNYPPTFDNLCFRFYPFLLGAPIDVGVPYSDSIEQHNVTTLTRARKIAKLPLPYVVSYRLFVSLVSSCYNHFALACDLPLPHTNSLKHAVTSILVPKRSRWVCREALYSLTTPGHLLSPHLFLNYRHLIEYLLYIKQADSNARDSIHDLWEQTLHIKWGPFYRLRNAAKQFGFIVEDPFVFVIHHVAYSVDSPLQQLKHLIRSSYRQNFLKQASQRRQDCGDVTHMIDISNTRAFYFSQTKPLLQTLLRQILTGAIDHAQRLFKSRLLTSPICPYCNIEDETAKHIFWNCPNWVHVRKQYPQLIRLYSLVGTQWPRCFLHCGWIEENKTYGVHILDDTQSPYTTTSFVLDTHAMYLAILMARHEASKVLQSTPRTPPLLLSSHPSHPSSHPSQPITLSDVVSPVSVQSSQSG